MSVTRHSLGASASGAESIGSTTLAGASAAVATMLSALTELSDGALLGLAKESLDQRAMRQRTANLRNVVSARSNQNIKMPSKKWERNEHTAILVQAAALCSRAVYRKDPAQVVPDVPGYTVEEKHWVEPTRDGSGKAAALFEIAPGAPPSNEKILIVAIRGSWCLVDWLVNLNDALEDAPSLVNLPKSTFRSDPKVHRGFAQCAKVLAPVILNQLKAALKDDHVQEQKIEIVFTGHSAGGAVATLLFTHFLTNQVLDPGSTKPTLSCITFGCPPLFSTEIDSRLTKFFSNGKFLQGSMLTFVNDGDPVPRMDAAYAAELARIWNRVGGSTCPPANSFTEFKPPKLSLSSLGQLVWLCEEENDFNDDQDEEEEGVNLIACHLDRSGLEQFAWANVMAHDMNLYVEFASIMGSGNLNGHID